MRKEAASIKQDVSSELKKITQLKLNKEEVLELTEKGITVKNPTKLTLLAAALYDKAAKGDLPALKEIFSRLAPEFNEGEGVVLIDDIKNNS